MTKLIIPERPAPVNSQGRVDFEDWRFDTLVYTKGLLVTLERAIVCPCKTSGSDNQTSCRNCLGTGYVWLSKIATRIVLQSMNVNTRFTQWSETMAGTSQFSARSDEKISFMDKITVHDSQSYYSQIINIFDFKDQLMGYTVYNPVIVECAFLFEDSERKLTKLEEGVDFTFRDNVFLLNEKYKNRSSNTVSITYQHELMYYVIDLNKESRNSLVIADSGREKEIRLPISGVCRRAHFVLDSQNFNQNLILDNSFVV
jgi:hypothetical protein